MVELLAFDGNEVRSLLPEDNFMAIFRILSFTRLK
jgi:hypothetical protein